ncbi:MAG: CrcB family protein [Euzebya sp.]
MTTAVTILVVMIGGSAGALIRWRLTTLNQRWPTGTLVANLLGSLLLGLLVGLSADPVLRAGLGTGVLGGLTTFSTFTVETVELPRRGGLGYVVISLGAGLAAVGAGLWLAGLAVS